MRLHLLAAVALLVAPPPYPALEHRARVVADYTNLAPTSGASEPTAHAAVGGPVQVGWRAFTVTEAVVAAPQHLVVAERHVYLHDQRLAGE
jgi:hypothetical protein